MRWTNPRNILVDLKKRLFSKFFENPPPLVPFLVLFPEFLAGLLLNFSKVFVAPIYTNFKGGGCAEKRRFFRQKFPKNA